MLWYLCVTVLHSLYVYWFQTLTVMHTITGSHLYCGLKTDCVFIDALKYPSEGTDVSK